MEDLLANPENKEWLSISAELCGGIYHFVNHIALYQCLYIAKVIYALLQGPIYQIPEKLRRLLSCLRKELLKVSVELLQLPQAMLLKQWNWHPRLSKK